MAQSESKGDTTTWAARQRVVANRSSNPDDEASFWDATEELDVTLGYVVVATSW